MNTTISPAPKVAAKRLERSHPSRYETVDASRNNWLIALLTLGEGWHNNHHHYQSSVNQGFFRWEIDVSYYIIRLLGLLGLVWDIRTPDAKALAHCLVR